MLEQSFLKVLNMSRAAGMVILVVLLARFLLKRFPKYISYMLWSVVLFRLLSPVIPESRLSPIPSLAPAFSEYVSEQDAAVVEKEPSAPGTEEEKTPAFQE